MRLTLKRKPLAPAQASQSPVEGVETRADVRWMSRLTRWLGRQARTVDEALHRRTIAVSVDTDAVHVLVVRRREVLAWGMASLGTEHETPEEGAATDQQRRRLAALRALLDR